MKNRVLWSVAALVVIVVGFVLDRTVLDDESGADAPVEHVDDGSDPAADTGDEGDVATSGADDAGGSDERDVPDEPDPSAESEPDDTGYRTHSDLPTVTLDELPPEAIEVLQLIEDGGPYEYRQDDSVFQNREGILPDRPAGHYREYTVETPGSPDRGPRRVVAGADGERYWTDDHYDSFSEIEF